MTSRLSSRDVERLMTKPSAEIRVETAEKVAEDFSSRDLSQSERRIAEDIFRHLMKDAEVRVREALSVQLKSCPDVPHDVAAALGRDVDSVALPMLRFSEVLTDADLIEILQEQGPEKQIAIAQRTSLSTAVSGAVIETNNDLAVARLAANEGAAIDDAAFEKLMERSAADESIAEGLARRTDLPPAMAERLVGAVTEQIESYLTAKANLPSDQVSNLILRARERATVGLLSDGSTEEELLQLVERLHVNGRLSSSLILRALCMGDIGFFEAAMAQLASVPIQNARLLIHDKGPLGLESVYLRTGLSEALFPAIRVAVEISRETEYDGAPNDRERHLGRMLERILTQCEDPSERLGDEDIEYLIHKLQQVAA